MGMVRIRGARVEYRLYLGYATKKLKFTLALGALGTAVGWAWWVHNSECLLTVFECGPIEAVLDWFGPGMIGLM